MKRLQRLAREWCIGWHQGRVIALQRAIDKHEHTLTRWRS